MCMIHTYRPLHAMVVTEMSNVTYLMHSHILLYYDYDYHDYYNHTSYVSNPLNTYYIVYTL